MGHKSKKQLPQEHKFNVKNSQEKCIYVNNFIELNMSLWGKQKTSS